MFIISFFSLYIYLFIYFFCIPLCYDITRNARLWLNNVTRSRTQSVCVSRIIKLCHTIRLLLPPIYIDTLALYLILDKFWYMHTCSFGHLLDIDKPKVDAHDRAEMSKRKFMIYLSRPTALLSCYSYSLLFILHIIYVYYLFLTSIFFLGALLRR